MPAAGRRPKAQETRSMADATQPSVYLRSRLLRRSDASSRPLRGWEFPDPHPPSIGRGVAGKSRGPLPTFSTQKKHYE